MILPNEAKVMNKFGVSIEDIDTCALYTAGDKDIPRLEYLGGSVDSASMHEREILEGIIERRTGEIRRYLHANPLKKD